jgi:hypothetical protein
MEVCNSCGCSHNENIQLFHLYEVTIVVDGEEKLRVIPVKNEMVTDEEIRKFIQWQLKGEITIKDYKRFQPGK